MNDRCQDRRASMTQVNRVWCNIHGQVGYSVCVHGEVDWQHELAVCDDFELSGGSVGEVRSCSGYLECYLRNVAYRNLRSTKEHFAVHKASKVDIGSGC